MTLLGDNSLLNQEVKMFYWEKMHILSINNAASRITPVFESKWWKILKIAEVPNAFVAIL